MTASGDRGWWCYYGRYWTDVKRDWQLAVDAAEKSALREMRGTY